MKSRLAGLCLMAMMGTVMVVSKEALAFLPNVELVSLLTILFTLVFRRKAIGGLAGVLSAIRIWPVVADVSVCVAYFGGAHLVVPMDETRLAVGHSFRPLWIGVWDTVFLGLPSHGRRFHGDCLDHQWFHF